MRFSETFWRTAVARLWLQDAALAEGADLRRIKQTFWYRAVLRRVFRNKPLALPLDISRVKKVLILRLDMSIGHSIIGSVLQKCLKDFNPALAVHLLTATEAEPIVRNDTNLDKIFLYHRKRLPSPSLIAALRRERYDAVFCVSFNSVTVDGVMANLAAPRAVKVVRTHDEAWRNDLYRVFFNKQLDTGGKRVPLWRQLASMVEQTFGVSYPESRITQTLFLEPASEARLLDFLRASQLEPARYAVINLSVNPRSYSLAYRQWGTGNVKNFITLFRAAHPATPVVFSCLPTDRAEAETLIAALGSDKLKRLPPDFGLPETMALVKYAECVITPDTAIAHIAACYRLPSVVLCATEAFSDEWIPCNPYHERLYGEGERGISQIAPADALAALHKAMQKKETHRTVTLTENAPEK